MVSLLESYGYYEWICHTNFSFLIGASHPHELIHEAIRHGYKGLAITDFDGVYGVARAYHYWQTYKNTLACSEFKLIYGAEIHLKQDHALPIIEQDTIVLLAQSHQGYFNLCRILSLMHRRGKTNTNILLEELLTSGVSGLVAIQPMRGILRTKHLNTTLNRFSNLKDIFKNNFYLTVSCHLNPFEDFCLENVLSLAKELDLPCLLSQDIFFHNSSQKDLSDVLHAIRNNKAIDYIPEQLFINGERSLHSLASIEKRFGKLPIFEAALSAAKKLSESFTFDLGSLCYHYPKEMLPPGFSAQAYLEQLTWHGATAFYGKGIPEKVKKLLNHELQLVAHLNFADYFLTVWDIVKWARQQNILCQGRGSAANSAICFVLGITSVNPDLFDVLFERFISVERGDPPDIDVDFEHERREEVIQYIYNRYGRDRAAMVANVITFKSRGAIRAVGKALGVPEVFLSQAAEILNAREFRKHRIQATMTELQVHNQDKTDLDSISWHHWAAMAERLKGFPRHLGIHCGGFILADKPLDQLVPQEPATMPDRTIIEWSKDDIEALGFFKIDILGLGMLSVIGKCFELIKTHYDKTLTLATIPQDDPQTYAMIQRGDTVGVFQIESRAQMSMLPRLKPKTFYDLVIEVAIIRPGPIQGKMIHPFLKRRDGKEPITFPHPQLKPILERTLGIPLFQEQIMRIAMAVGNFTPGEANELRKNMGSFSLKGDLGPWVTKLAQGMRKNGISEQFINQILEQMKGFAHYGFPESHAASFALLAYASSYLKCHYPEIFFVALLNSQPMGFYVPHVLIQTAMRLGIEVLPICINNSHWQATLEKRKGKLAIRLGLEMVKALAKQAAETIVSKRPAGGWHHLAEFVTTNALSRLDLTALATANALQCFNLGRRSAIWLAQAAPFSSFLEDDEQQMIFPEETNRETIELDFYSTSTVINMHPAQIIREKEWCYEIPTKNICLAKHITDLKTNQRTYVFGMVLVRQSPPTANGMVFVTIEDETGLINLVFKPNTHKKYRNLIDHSVLICVSGILQRQGDAHSLLVDQLYAPVIKKADVIAMAVNDKTDKLNLIEAEELVATRNYM